MSTAQDAGVSFEIPPGSQGAGPDAFVPATPQAVAAQAAALAGLPDGADLSRLLEGHAGRAAAHGQVLAAHRMIEARRATSAPGDLAAAATPRLRRALVAGLGAAVEAFRAQAYFTGLRVAGRAVTAPAGCLRGPELAPHVVTAPALAVLGGAEAALRDIVAGPVSAAFGAWRAGVTVPGLDLYPDGIDGPTPNRPVPLAVLDSDGAAGVAGAWALATRIKVGLPPGAATPALTGFCEEIAATFAGAFASWLSSCQVTGLIALPDGATIPAPAPLARGSFVLMPRR